MFKQFPKRLFCKIVSSNFAKSIEINWSYLLKTVSVHHKIKLIKFLKILRHSNMKIQRVKSRSDPVPTV